MNSHANNVDHMSPITTLYGSHSPWNAPEFPLIQHNKDHTVLYKIPTDGFTKPPAPVAGRHEKWDSHHVKMPTSDQSVYDVSKAMVFTSSESRWKIIEKALKKPIKDSKDLAKVILKYNTKFANTWYFESMHKFFDQYWEQRESKEFFKNTLPSIARLALDLPSLVQAPIPMLKKEMNKSISLSQLQIACLLANAFFCTFPRRNTTGPGTEYGEYPRINFTSLYESNAEGTMEKLKCICHYFKRVCGAMPKGVLTFSRRTLPMSSCPSWERSQVPLGSVPFHVDDHVQIEDAEGTIQVDFANKYLGGGVLGGGLVQEEIRFMICPELMVGMLFTEKLGPFDALMILGCERYSNYTGYGRVNFRWAGDFHDKTPMDGSGRKRCAVLAIDAQNFHDERRQYQRDMIFRELNKAYIGFSFFTDKSSPGLQYPGVATGNWGCGAFNGSPQLKALVQLMACAQARRPIAYLTFKDASLKDEVIKVFNMLKQHEVTVGGLFKLIAWYHKIDFRVDLNAFVRCRLLDKKDTPPAYQSSGLPGSQTTYSSNYHTPSSFGSSPNFSAYSSPTHVGRGRRNRSSAPTQTEPFSGSPPEVALSTSYFYDLPGGNLPSSIGKRYNTESSVHRRIEHTTTNPDIQRHSQKQFDQNSAQEYAEDEPRRSSKQRSPSLSEEDLISFKDKSSTTNRGQTGGPSEEQPPAPGFKVIRDQFERKACQDHELAPPGTEELSDRHARYKNQSEPHNHSVTSHIGLSHGDSKARPHNDQPNRASDHGRNTLPSEEQPSRIYPNIDEDINNEPLPKPQRNYQSGVTAAVAPSWLKQDQHQPRNKAPEQSTWQDSPMLTTYQGSYEQSTWQDSPMLTTYQGSYARKTLSTSRSVPMETQPTGSQGSARSEWQNHQRKQAPVPMETDTSHLSSDALSQGVDQKVDNPSSHRRANSDHGLPKSQQDVMKCEQAMKPSEMHITQICDAQMADESDNRVGNAISTSL